MKLKRFLLIINLFYLGGLMAIDFYSPAFSANQMIPEKYTCDGADISPPLEWKNFPKETKSFALIMDDPDAPVGLWIHWVLYNIPVEVTKLPENLEKKEKVKINTYELTQGKNSWPKIGYGGPCPPDKQHRYFFKLYALKEKTNFSSGLTANELESKIKNLILEKAEFFAVYDLKKRRK
ncbi:MAG: YbhB/YbcL family Raf kinase inhibitor-like protein [Leptonema sp. (in: bacteria)]